MAKNNKPIVNQDMTLEESKAYRASLYRPTSIVLNDAQKRENFRLFWAQQKRKYSKFKGIGNIEDVLWLHLKASKLDEPKDFAKGLQNFGLKQVR